MEDLKKAVCDAVDANKERIYKVAEKILENPELGYREQKRHHRWQLIYSLKHLLTVKND